MSPSAPSAGVSAGPARVSYPRSSVHFHCSYPPPSPRHFEKDPVTGLPVPTFPFPSLLSKEQTRPSGCWPPPATSSRILSLNLHFLTTVAFGTLVERASLFLFTQGLCCRDILPFALHMAVLPFCISVLCLVANYQQFIFSKCP